MRMTKCVRFRGTSHDFVLGTTVYAVNRSRRAERFTCEAQQSKTVEFSVSASVEAEAGVIFAKAKTSVSAGVKRSVTQTIGMRWGPFRVPARSFRSCEFGVSTIRVHGTFRRHYKEPGQPWTTTRSRFSAKLPTGPSAILNRSRPL
jgi:hypothetical protein